MVATGGGYRRATRLGSGGAGCVDMRVVWPGCRTNVDVPRDGGSDDVGYVPGSGRHGAGLMSVRFFPAG